MGHGLFSANVTTGSVVECDGMGGKKSLAEIIKDDSRFETKKLASDRSDELAVNIYFAWDQNFKVERDPIANEEARLDEAVRS